jgi:hypothetical protein
MDNKRQTSKKQRGNVKDSQDPSVLLSWHWCASSMNQFASFLAEDGGQVYA